MLTIELDQNKKSKHKSSLLKKASVILLFSSLASIGYLNYQHEQFKNSLEQSLKISGAADFTFLNSYSINQELSPLDYRLASNDLNNFSNFIFGINNYKMISTLLNDSLYVDIDMMKDGKLNPEYEAHFNKIISLQYLPYTSEQQKLAETQFHKLKYIQSEINLTNEDYMKNFFKLKMKQLTPFFETKIDANGKEYNGFTVFNMINKNIQNKEFLSLLQSKEYATLWKKYFQDKLGNEIHPSLYLK